MAERRYIKCPSEQCTAANPRRIRLDAASLTKTGITGDWVERAMRCGYCGVIFSVESDGSEYIRGRFKSDLMEPGNWIPLDA